MEKDIGQHGGNGSPLHDACVGMVQHPFFPDPGTEPFPNKAHYPPIIDPLAEHVPQLSPVNTVVGREKPRLPLCLSPQVKPGVRISRTGLPRTHS
jgi:hypothetical protein